MHSRQEKLLGKIEFSIRVVTGNFTAPKILIFIFMRTARMSQKKLSISLKVNLTKFVIQFRLNVAQYRHSEIASPANWLIEFGGCLSTQSNIKNKISFALRIDRGLGQEN